MDLSLERQCLENGSLTVEEVAVLVAIAMEHHGMTPVTAQTEEYLILLMDSLESTAGAETVDTSTTPE